MTKPNVCSYCGHDMDRDEPTFPATPTEYCPARSDGQHLNHDA